jgi:hypothetical protein
MASSGHLPRVFTAVFVLSVALHAHDLERTHVRIAFADDGTFVVDVANDPAWLLLRLEPFAGRTIPPNISPAERDRRLAELVPVFIDRVVFFVDEHEVRPASGEYLPAQGAYRLRGRLPPGARTLRWFYGLVIDPYPLTVRTTEGSARTLTVAGEAWSEAIAIPPPGRASGREIAFLVGAAAIMVSVRAWRSRRSAHRRERTNPPSAAG